MTAAAPSVAPVIVTERLILRGHRLEDFEDCCRLTSDPEAVRAIYLKPVSREDTWHRMMRFVGHWTLLGYGLFIVEERATGHVVGEAGLADFHRGLGDDFDPYPEFAWMFSHEVHGRGYATEAAHAALQWIETGFAPPRTVCIIDPDNAPSLRVAEKLGFKPFAKADYKDKTVIKLERFAAMD